MDVHETKLPDLDEDLEKDRSNVHGHDGWLLVLRGNHLLIRIRCFLLRLHGLHALLGFRCWDFLFLLVGGGRILLGLVQGHLDFLVPRHHP